MCGRFSLSVPASLLSMIFNSQDLPNIMPNYNIVPTQDIWMVAIGREGNRRIVKSRWGLMPQWMDKDPKTGPLFNARAETILEKPSFKNAFVKRRCIIPADGFYEWHREDKVKTPYYICRADEKPMGFAGLWEMKRRDDGEILVSSTIITTAASEKFASIHQRFPVVLEQNSFDDWLSPNSNPRDLQKLLSAPTDDKIAINRISDDVNKVANNSENLKNKLL